MSLESQNLGCIWLQICGFLARFCRHLQCYVLDLVDVSMGLVQFETRHPPHKKPRKPHKQRKATALANSA